MAVSLKNFGFRNKSGILMSISALPNAYGIGSFGKSAYQFVDFLADTGTRCWQVLPLGPTSYGDSPYQSPACMAGNPYFIDLEILAQKGLLTRDALKQNRHPGNRVDYGWLFQTRIEVLKQAYSRFLQQAGEKTPQYGRFQRRNRDWLPDYCLFMALKEHYGYKSWVSWAPEHRHIASARRHSKAFLQQCGFWRWVQYEFDCQWQALLAYAHENNILIIGDIPIYVAHDSMDVWASPEQFALDDEGNPTVVAGCPPDGFTPDGQLWGNPIYNWEKMEQDGFAWWCRRMGRSFRMYDIVRIDHFRGFAGYYNIPYGHTTARLGKWDPAPGIALFRTLGKKYPRGRVIAEDLGYITPDVVQLMEDTGFPGMKMLQFAFYDDDAPYLPRMYENANCVVYPGSHDADCVKTWCANISGQARRRFDRECPHTPGKSRTYDLIRFAMESKANLAVVPIQDYLELNNDQGRMNTPATAQGNWTWRIRPRYRTDALTQKIRTLTCITGRANEKGRRL